MVSEILGVLVLGAFVVFCVVLFFCLLLVGVCVVCVFCVFYVFDFLLPPPPYPHVRAFWVEFWFGKPRPGGLHG